MEGVARPGLPREETVGAREESKSGGSKNVNKDSIGGGFGPNKNDSKSKGKQQQRRTNISMC